MIVCNRKPPDDLFGLRYHLNHRGVEGNPVAFSTVIFCVRMVFGQHK